MSVAKNSVSLREMHSFQAQKSQICMESCGIQHKLHLAQEKAKVAGFRRNL